MQPGFEPAPVQARRKPIVRLTAALIVVVAAAAGLSLWVIGALYRQSARAAAARSVVDTGRLMALRLADEPALRSPDVDPKAWAEFDRLVQSFRTLETSVQYVSVQRGGITLFHEQMGAMEGGSPPPLLPSASELRRVVPGREILIVGSNSVPVITFTVAVPSPTGLPSVVRLAVARDAVRRERGAPVAAISAMYRVSLATVGVAFCLCALLLIWVIRRDIRREARRMAEEHLAFAGVVANGIAHDFRNPMSSLKLDLQMLGKEAAREREARPERLIELAGRAESTLNRMDGIFQEFLALSRPAQEEPSRLSLRECLHDSLGLLAPRLEQKAVTVTPEFPAGDLFAFGHASGLQRALVNVLANAIEFSPAGGCIIARAARNRDRIVLEVLDQGPGVPEPERERIFELFVSNRTGGTGIGLALARNAIEKMGGTIVALNRPEGGACFRIVLQAAA